MGVKLVESPAIKLFGWANNCWIVCFVNWSLGCLAGYCLGLFGRYIMKFGYIISQTSRLVRQWLVRLSGLIFDCLVNKNLLDQSVVWLFIR